MADLLQQVTSVLQTTPLVWQNLADRVPPELLGRAPAPGEWSAIECLQHLIDTERFAFPVRVRAFLQGQDFPAFDPDTQGTRPGAASTVADLVADFARLRSKSLALLATVTESDLPRTARHAELGPVTLEQMLNEWAAHDLMHTVQAQRALMQPFVPNTGAWRPYFKDHDVEVSS